MLLQWWVDVAVGGPTLSQHWVKVWYLSSCLFFNEASFPHFVVIDSFRAYASRCILIFFLRNICWSCIERVHFSPCKVADTPFPVQGNDIWSTSLQNVHLVPDNNVLKQAISIYDHIPIFHLLYLFYLKMQNLKFQLQMNEDILRNK